VRLSRAGLLERQAAEFELLAPPILAGSAKREWSSFLAVLFRSSETSHLPARRFQRQILRAIDLGSIIKIDVQFCSRWNHEHGRS